MAVSFRAPPPSFRTLFGLKNTRLPVSLPYFLENLQISSVCLYIATIARGGTSYLCLSVTLNKMVHSAKPRNKSRVTWYGAIVRRPVTKMHKHRDPNFRHREAMPKLHGKLCKKYWCMQHTAHYAARFTAYVSDYASFAVSQGKKR